jgi:hypothetical protein
MGVITLKNVCNSLIVKHVHRMSALSCLNSHPCMANMWRIILEVQRYLILCLTLWGPMSDWVCHLKFWVPVLCWTQSTTCFMNVIHDLESVWWRQTVSVYHSRLHLCSGVNHPYLVILCELYNRFCKGEKGNCITNSFMISTCHQIFSGWSNWERLDGQDIQPAWRWQMHRTY